MAAWIVVKLPPEALTVTIVLNYGTVLGDGVAKHYLGAGQGPGAGHGPGAGQGPGSGQDYAASSVALNNRARLRTKAPIKSAINTCNV